MARLKVGTEIKNYGEVTNLIIGLINRTTQFKADLIIKLTFNYIHGSSVSMSDKDISRMVYNVLDKMQKYGYVTLLDEIYTLKSTSYTIAEFYKHNHEGSIIL